MQLMHDLLKLEKSVLFLNYHSKRGYGNHRRIDVWWRGRDRNAQLMLMLAHIIRSNEAWENAQIRLLRLLENEKGRNQAKAYMAEFLKKVRVRATPVVLVNNRAADSFADTLSRCSTDTDLILLGLPGPQVGQFRTQAFNIRRLMQPLPSTLLVRSAEVEDILQTANNE